MRSYRGLRRHSDPNQTLLTQMQSHGSLKGAIFTKYTVGLYFKTQRLMYNFALN